MLISPEVFYHFHSSLFLMNHFYPTLHLHVLIHPSSTLQFPVVVFQVSFKFLPGVFFVGLPICAHRLVTSNPMDQVGREVGQRLAEQQARSTLVVLMLHGEEDKDDDVIIDDDFR